MKRLIIVGSPRTNGRSAHLAEMLFETNIEERPEDELYLVPVSEVEIGPCIGCGACLRTSKVTFKDEAGGEVTELRHRCVFDDDMQTLYDLLDEVDELIVVSPVYFSGAPAPMKCVFDRMQPYFWITQQRGREIAASVCGARGKGNEDDAGSEGDGLAAGSKDAIAIEGDSQSAYVKRLLTKRPATLHVIGEGGDPHGFDPLVGEAKSALACAGFRLERVLNWVGKIDENGEITDEATEILLVETDSERSETMRDNAAARNDSTGKSAAATRGGSARKNGTASHDGSAGKSSAAEGRPRPKLDLSSSTRRQSDKQQSQKPAKGRGKAQAKGSGKSKSKGGRRG